MIGRDGEGRLRATGVRKRGAGNWVLVWGIALLPTVMAARGQESPPAAEQAQPSAAQSSAAQSSAAQSSAAAQTMYSDAANYQNNRAFDLAAEEWKRFLERYSDDPLAAKARHYRGVCLVQLKQYPEAIAEFQSVVSQHPQFELLEDTYLNLGWSQYSLALAGDKDRYAQAVETFNKLRTAHPSGKNVDQAMFFEAESLYAVDRKKDAAIVYGKLVTDCPESKLRADALYALGVTLEELEQWAQATKAYDMYLADFATSDLATEVRMRKAETLMQTGDAKAAEALFAEVVAVNGFPAADHALLRQASAVVEQGRLSDAAQLYGSLVTRFPESANAGEAALAAGRCFYRLEQYDEAAKWLDKAVASGGAGSTEAAHWLCRIYLRQHDVAKALELADRKLAGSGDAPFTPNLRLDHADALYETQGRQSEALQEYLALAESHATHEVGPVALYNAAFAALELKQYDQAANLAEKFVAAYPQQTLLPDVRYVLGECHMQKGQYDQAAAIYRELIAAAKEHPDHWLWHVRLGLALNLQKNYQDVVDLLTPVLAQMPNPPLKAESYYLIGISQFALEQFEHAITSLRESLLTDAKWRQADETLVYLARAQQKLGQLPAAVSTLGELLKSFPDGNRLDEAYYHLGECHYAGGQLAEAVTAYDQVIQRFAASAFVPFALYGKGWALLKGGDYESALASFTTLIQQHAGHELADDALFARGMCYRQAKKYPEAIADIEQYLTAHPQSAQRGDALYERGLAEAAAQQYAKAVETYASLLEQYPEYAQADKVLYEQAWAYQSLPDPAAAARTFGTLAEKYPGSPLAAEANFHVGENLYAQKQYAQAVTAYQKSAQANNAVIQEKVLYKMGWSYYQLQQYREALGAFESLLAAAGDGELASDAWFMKGECLFRLQDYAQALPALQQAIGREASSPQIAVLRQLHAAQAAGQLDRWQESIDLLNPLIEKYSDSYYAAEASFERGRARQKLDQLEDAIQDFRQAAEKSRDVVGIRAQFMVGEVEFQQKRYDDAIKDFQRTMFRSGADQGPAEMRNWQAKAGFEAGRCSEVQIQQAASPSLRAKYIADAKKFYQYVVQSHPDHELAQEAKKRMESLAKLVP